MDENLFLYIPTRGLSDYGVANNKFPFKTKIIFSSGRCHGYSSFSYTGVLHVCVLI